MKLIGLTGGIGSGKSTVAEIFRTIGIPVYESDSKAKEIMATDANVRTRIIDLFGAKAYDNSNIDRTWIAEQVFSDRQKLEKLNAIVHPAVFADLVNWVSEEEQLNAPYLIQESAIIFEEDLLDRFDAVILVVANEEARISRVMERDRWTRDKVLDRMAHQWKDDAKIPLADYVIFNDSERPLINQVMDIDKMIKARFTSG
jgi:dephospho-CoA kinase